MSDTKKRNQQVWESVVPDLVLESEFCPNAINELLTMNKKRYPADVILNVRKHLLHVGWKIEYARVEKQLKVRYVSPDGSKTFYCLPKLVADQYPVVGEDGRCSNLKPPPTPDVIEFKKPDSGVDSEYGTDKLEALRKIKGQMQGEGGECESGKGRKRVREGGIRGDSSDCKRRKGGIGEQAKSSVGKRVREEGDSCSKRNPRTILSCLIDSNVVVEGSKVSYRKKDGTTLAEGRITRKGIECSHCQMIFMLSKFEAHAGSTYHRPSEFLFLEDGRSLTSCQMQLTQDMCGGRRSSRKEEIDEDDFICSVCFDNGELMLCDRCPSGFHPHCLGLKGVPDGNWFCPLCYCNICGGDFGKKGEQSTAVLACAQCERKCHAGCANNTNSDSHVKEHWFCCDKCKHVFSGLQKRVGKPVTLEKTKNLRWNLIKCDSPENDELEIQSKLNVALSVMHECFDPLEDPYSKRDIVEDVIFSKTSNLNRLNFKGFYTFTLEDEDEMISAATVRVFGDKVAELPLVATRFKYRRRGMCRILMDELEKMLKELGVERLVLPAIPSTLDTWTNSFGFSVMSGSERLKFLDYTFLGFVRTDCCQKIL